MSSVHCQTCCSWVPRYHSIGTGVFYHCSCCWREFDNNWTYSTSVAWRGNESERDPRCDFDVPFTLAFPLANGLTENTYRDLRCEHNHKVPKSKSVFIQVLNRSLQAAEKGMDCTTKKKQMQAHVINLFSSLVSPCFFHDQPLSCLPLRSCGSPCKKRRLE